MPPVAVCPDLAKYQKLAAGQLADADEEALLKHLEACEVCAQKLNTLAEPDTLAGLIHQAQTLVDRVPDGTLARLIERLSKLRPGEASAGDKHTLHWTAGPGANPKAPGEASTGHQDTRPPREPAPSAGLAFACPACGKRLKVQGELAGKKVKCPHCKEPVRVPGGTGSASIGVARTLAPGKPAARGAATGSYHPAAMPAKELYDFLAPPKAPDEIGRLGPYRVLAVLGAGGMGVVFRAEDPQLNRLVALKAMLPSLAGAESGRQRFLREARAAAAIKHDHIVAVYQVGEDRGVPFLAMEFLEGEPLDKRLTREGKLPVVEVLRFGREIALGLAAAHKRGLMHRDIKPANLWLEAETGRIKVLDFGLARAAKEASPLTQSGAIVGTPEYMAPEQVQGKDLDERCDLFSLGCVLYRMSTGLMPFTGPDMISTLMAVATENPRSPRDLEPSMPAALSKLILRLLAKEPGQRPESAQAVAGALQELEERTQEGSGTTGAKTACPRPSWFGKKSPPRPWLIGLAGGLLAAVLAGIVLYWPTPRGLVKIESDDPSVEIVFDKTGPTIKGAGKEPITLRAGEHGVAIKRGDFEFEADRFLLKKGATITLRVELLKGKLQVSADGQMIGEKALPAVAAVGASPGGPLPKTFTNSLGIEFVLVPNGTFLMGGGGGTPGNKEVAIAHDFYLGKYEVTQGEWEKVTGLTPSWWFRTGGGKDMVKDIADAELKRFPVEQVSWDVAQLFLEALNERDKKAGWLYRLPKEAEWEYACRGGPTSNKSDYGFDFYFEKPTNQLLPEQANFEHGKGLKRTRKVGSYPPNRLGLYDMHGNVWEWCDDSERGADGASLRVFRGGSWFDASGYCRAALRGADPPSARHNSHGLRVARVPVGKVPVAPPPLEQRKPETPAPAAAPDGKIAAYENGGAKWRIEGSELILDSPKSGGGVGFGDASWTDYDLTVQAQRIQGEDLCFVAFRGADVLNRYDFMVGGSGGSWSITVVSRVDGKGKVLAQDKRVADEKWHTIGVKVRGTRIECFLDDIREFRLDDDHHPSGRVGLATRNATTRFRNLKITDSRGRILVDGIHQLVIDPEEAAFPTNDRFRAGTTWKGKLQRNLGGLDLPEWDMKIKVLKRQGRKFEGEFWTNNQTTGMKIEGKIDPRGNLRWVTTGFVVQGGIGDNDFVSGLGVVREKLIHTYTSGRNSGGALITVGQATLDE